MKILRITYFLILINIFVSCQLYKKTDKNVPQNAQERARKNIDEGRGFSIANIGKGLSKTNYEFATSNSMWRASLEILDFIPFATIDYSGGLIISDWYKDTTTTNTSIKITIRFLDNKVSASSLKIIIHEKFCDNKQNCTTKLLKKSKIQDELTASILKKAAILEKQIKK